MALANELPELVRDTELETELHEGYTIHVHRDAPQRAAPPRQEVWKRQKRIGEGGYGIIWLETCASGRKPNGPLHRAVKQIGVQSFSDVTDYHRELDAFAKFSQERVRLASFFQLVIQLKTNC